MVASDAGTNQTPPEWTALQAHPVPAWFDDAKFGIYCHWGPYSVPAFDTEWYSRNMYIPGHKANLHHLETYGPVSQFGYKDFIPMFTAEHFDPDAWTDLFRRAGARYIGPVSEHADGFSMWDSRVNPFNAARMGPQRDVVGEMARAVREQGLHFLATFHHMWLWAWYPTTDPNADASDPAYADLYGPPTRPEDFQNPRPDEAFCDRFVAKIKEVVDAYQPDVMYFDSRLATISDRHRRAFIAYYYEQAEKWGREVTVTYKNEDLPPGVGILDVERGRMRDAKPFKWMTDDSICWRSWAHLHEPSYKSAKRIIDGLVDIVSKNGNLLLNVPPTADGRIPEPVQERLLEIGDWLAINGEAIYGTRPWRVYGEGPTEVHEGHFSEKENAEMTAADVRFTAKPDALYAIVMGWPGEQIRISSLTPERLPAAQIAGVELLGVEGSLPWQQTGDGFTVDLPRQAPPSPHAVTLKIAFK